MAGDRALRREIESYGGRSSLMAEDRALWREIEPYGG